MTFIEFCCSSKSKASDERYRRPGTRFIRITEDDDPSTEDGLRQLLSYIEDPNSGHVVVLSSIPCTLGCTFHYINRNRKCMDNPVTYAKYLELQAQHQERFDKLVTVLEHVVEALLKVGGDLIHEWGAYNMLWNNQRIVELINSLGLKRVRFDGCALGLRDPKTQKYIRKPRAFSTTLPRLSRSFRSPSAHVHQIRTLGAKVLWLSCRPTTLGR